MTVFLTKPDGRIVLLIRAEGDGAIGDALIEIEPGRSAFGRSHDEWAALPPGPYRVH